MRFLTRKEARAALGEMPERTFRHWLTKGLPCKGDGARQRFPWPEISRWLIQHARQEGRDSVKPADYEDAKARKMIAEAELAEYDVALKRGELMTVAEGEKTMSEAFHRIRGKLLAVPTRLAADFLGIKTLPEANARLTTAMTEVLEELAGAEDVPAPEEEDAEAEV